MLVQCVRERDIDRQTDRQTGCNLLLSCVSDFQLCHSGDDAPVIVFVSKMVAVERKTLPKHRQR